MFVSLLILFCLLFFLFFQFFSLFLFPFTSSKNFRSYYVPFFFFFILHSFLIVFFFVPSILPSPSISHFFARFILSPSTCVLLLLMIPRSLSHLFLPFAPCSLSLSARILTLTPSPLILTLTHSSLILHLNQLLPLSDTHSSLLFSQAFTFSLSPSSFFRGNLHQLRLNPFIEELAIMFTNSLFHAKHPPSRLTIFRVPIWEARRGSSRVKKK